MTSLARMALVAVLLGIMALTGSMSQAAPPAMGAAQTCSDKAQFVADVTVPDNTIVRPGQAFNKTWRLRNTGNCTWSTSYKLMRDSGDAMGSPASVRLPRTVTRNSTVDISLQLIAPVAPGTYTGFWQMADASSRRFGPKIRVIIVVPDATHGGSLPDTLTRLEGGGAGLCGCACSVPNRRLPVAEVRYSRIPSWNGDFEDARISWRQALICVFGLPERSDVTLTLRSPDGRRFSTREVASELQDMNGRVVGTATETWAYFSPAFPAGTWVLTVDGSSLHQVMQVEVIEPAVAPNGMAVAPFAPFDPFNENRIQSHPVGEEITILGESYLPNAQIPVGIYGSSGNYDAWTLAHAEMATTDANGSLQVPYRIPLSLVPGRYWAVLWSADLESRFYEQGNQMLGDRGTQAFYVRASADSPLPIVEAGAWGEDSGVWTFAFFAWNWGTTANRGGSLTLSSPDAERLEISDADVPILPSNWSDCNIATPHAWVLTSETPCHRALQNNTACKKTVSLTYPLAEAWYQSWATGESHSFRVRVWPKPGMREVRIYARVAMLAGASGCRIEIAPREGEGDAIDQQGFPAQMITLSVP